MPPGAAMGPSIVQAERKIAAVVRRRVSECAQWPLGGQHDDDDDDVSLNDKTALCPGGEGDAR